MAAVWEEPHLCDGLGVVFVGMYKLLWYEVLRFVLSGELDVEIGRNVHIRPSLVIVLLAALELGCFALGLGVVVVGACQLLRRSFWIFFDLVFFVYYFHLFIAPKFVV